jgi:NTP pyrophosphatase (non-canonical NTP hydrolase)
MNSRAEKRVHKFLKDRGWDQLRPADLAKSVMIEGGELLELFQWENLSLEEVKKDKEKLAEIEKELADVLIYALEIAVLLGLGTEKIIFEKLARAEKKYPAKLMKKNATTGAGSGRDPLYWKIKKIYRQKGK